MKVFTIQKKNCTGKFQILTVLGLIIDIRKKIMIDLLIIHG